MAYVLAILTGVLTAAAFPLLGAWPLIFVAYVPLMVALQDEPRWRRLRIGWTAGIATMLGMQYWISHTMVYLSGFPWWAAILTLLLYAVVYGAGHAVFGLAYGPIRRFGGRTPWILIVPIAWVLVERLFPYLFPFYAGNALHEVPVLMQSAEWFGIGGISWLVLLANCAVAHAVEERARGIASDYFVPIAVSSLWLMLTVWGVVRMDQVWSAPTRATHTVALIQPNVTVPEKRDPRITSRANAWTRTVQMTRQALKYRPDLVVWPEGGFPFRFVVDAKDRPADATDTRDDVYSRRLYRLALDLNVDFVAGGLRTRGERTRNSAMYFERGGQPVRVYDKQQLLPFGEHFPLADRFTWLRDRIEGMTHHEHGEGDATWRSGDIRLAAGICYEAIFPEITRRQMNHDDADVLLNLTNDVWFGDTAAPYLHLMVQQVRAIEMRSWLVRSTNSGVSAFIDPTGRMRSKTRLDTQDTLITEMSIPDLPPSPYRRFGDLWLYIATALSGLFLLWGRQRLAKKMIRGGNLQNESVSNSEPTRSPAEDEHA